MQSRTYALEVEGELSDEMAYVFEGMRLRREHGNTVLVGVAQDQAALQGLLQRLSDLGLTLLSVNAVTDGPGAEPRASTARPPH
jgi:hypothetical protein